MTNPVIVLHALRLDYGGTYAFVHVNVEAYPDRPAIKVVARSQALGGGSGTASHDSARSCAGRNAGLTYTRSKSLFGLSHLRNQFDYGVDFEKAKQEVINRLQLAMLPPSVTPQISPASPTGEIFRYTLTNPRDARGRPTYEIRDLKSLQDFTLDRELRRVPRIAGVVAAGGEVKRYEIHPDPARLAQYGVTLQQLQARVASSNRNASGEYLNEGQTVQVVRGLGLIGRGIDPLPTVFVLSDPVEAAQCLRNEEARRLREARQVGLASLNNQPIRVDQVVDGGPLLNSDGTARVGVAEFGKRGVIVSHTTRLGRVSIRKPQIDDGGEDRLTSTGEPIWDVDDDVVRGIVLLRKGAESLPALADLKAKVALLNEPGHMLPGVKIEPHYDRTG